MKKIILYILPVICIFSCNKEPKLYKNIPERSAQIAFENSAITQRIQINTTSFRLPINLIAQTSTTAINATITVNPETNCAATVTVPATATIAAGGFSTNITIDVDYSALAATPSSGTIPNRLILDLSTTSDVLLAENYKRTTILLNKIEPNLMFDVSDQKMDMNDAKIENDKATFESIVVRSAYNTSNTTVTLDIDGGLVNEYNTENNLTGSAAYVLMPVTAYTLPTSAIFGTEAKSTSQPFDLIVDMAGLTSGGKYLIPIVIKSATTSVGSNPARVASINADRDYLLLLVDVP